MICPCQVRLESRSISASRERHEPRTEILAGLTTFRPWHNGSQPAILADAFSTQWAAMATTSARFMIATILSTAVTTILMGLYATYPFALAPEWGSTHTSLKIADES